MNVSCSTSSASSAVAAHAQGDRPDPVAMAHDQLVERGTVAARRPLDERANRRSVRASRASIGNPSARAHRRARLRPSARAHRAGVRPRTGRLAAARVPARVRRRSSTAGSPSSCHCSTRRTWSWPTPRASSRAACTRAGRAGAPSSCCCSRSSRRLSGRRSRARRAGCARARACRSATSSRSSSSS